MISAFIKKLLFVRQFSIIDGKVDLLGTRQIMFPTEFFYEIQSSSKDAYKLSKEVTLKNMKDLGKKLGASESGMINSMEDVFETYGFGPLEIVDLDNKKKEVNVRVKDSALARDYLKVHKSAKSPQCKLVSGVLAGMFSFLFKVNVECKETKCLCSGDALCSFKVKKG